MTDSTITTKIKIETIEEEIITMRTSYTSRGGMWTDPQAYRTYLVLKEILKDYKSNKMGE